MRQFLQRLATIMVSVVMLVMPVAVLAMEGGGGSPPPMMSAPPPMMAPPAGMSMPPGMTAPPMMSPPPGGQPGMMPDGQGMMNGNMMPPPGSQPGLMPGQAGPNMPPGMTPGMTPGQMMDQGKNMMTPGMIDQAKNMGMMPGGQPGMMGGEMMKGGQSGMMGQDGGQREGMNRGEHGQGMTGPSDEDMERMEKQREEQEKKMRLRGLQGMKRGMKQFDKILTNFKKQLEKLAAQGVPVPTDCKEIIEKASATVTTILTTEDPEAIEGIDMSELQEAGEALRECGPKIEQAKQLPRIIKQIKARLTKLESQVKAVSAKAERSGLDFSAPLQKINDGVTALRATVDGLAANDDPFAALEDLPEQFQDIQQQMESLDALFQLQKAAKSIKSQLARYERQVKRLEKNGEGKEARQFFDELKSVVTELQSLKLTEDSVDDLPEKMQRALELKGSLEEELDITQGPPALFNINSGSGGGTFDVPKFDKLMFDQRQLQSRVARLTGQANSAMQQVAGFKMWFDSAGQQ